MRRTVIVVPDLLGETPDDSPLIQKLPTLQAMAELGELKRIARIPATETPESIWLGLKPTEAQMAQGPLTVAALGQDPPDRSTHFHVTLLGLLEGQALLPPPVVADEDLRGIVEEAKKLNTRTMTFLPGENLDHALVWEGLGDMRTVPARQVGGESIKGNLPEGDAEKELRRFIDDSVNLLNELELNERRIDEGIAPLNLLWPWGQGRRQAVPNLILKRGERARVESNSMRLAGLTRLVGYKHGSRAEFGRGTGVKFDRLAEIGLKENLSIFLVESPAEFRSDGKLEELHWFVSELDRRLLKPLFDSALRSRSRLTVVASGMAGGLVVNFDSAERHTNAYPFDERSLEEKALPTVDAWTAIDRSLEPLPNAQRT